MQAFIRFFIKQVAVVLLVSSCFSSVMQAVSFHAPLLIERGPLRYLFDFDEPSGSRNIKTWVAAYSRYASQAYKSEVGTQTDELSRLFFNESDFKLTDAFPNCLILHNVEYYNPLLRTVHIHSKVDNREMSIVFGGRYAVPVYKDVGRLGVRVSVPLKSVEIRRLDVDGVPRGAELEEVVAVAGQIVPRSGIVTNPPDRGVPMVRMDFAEALVQSNKNNPALNISSLTQHPKIGGQNIDNIDFSDKSAFVSSIGRCVAVVRSPRGFIPRPPDVKNTAIVTTFPSSTTPTATEIAAADGTDAVLPADGNAEYKLVYRFETTGNPGKYSKLADDTTQDIDARRARQRLKEELWLIPRVYYSDSALVGGFSEGGAIKTLIDLSSQVTENAFEWLSDRGFAFEGSYNAGFGDCSIDFFYEHALSDKCYGEVFVGAVLPTAQEKEDFSSPYRAALGNGKHWEMKLGGMLALQPFSSLNIKADCAYACVIPREEAVRAAFKGARVKNVGPLVQGYIGWNYYVARLEATIFHLKARAISNTFGYEFFYKERDALVFPRNNTSTWQGRTFDVDGSVLRNEYPLDASIATSNTDSVAHRCKFETSFRITNQCEFCLGLGYTFAGKNVPRAIDGSLVLNVLF